ncbi:MAG: 2-oxo acid dehydrogenase subunit E2 [Thaumarchaeota archaeon]|nr:2-oxo acid dehydrogenase subunit E2 [Nitrososphaerota archaeon]
MVLEFKLPDVGEGVAEGEIRRWFVKIGDQVSENQPLVEVMTDKVTVEIPSPKSGTVLDILAKEGQVVKVGTTIIIIGEKGEHTTLRSQPEPKSIEASSITPPVSAPARAASVLATPATRRLARELGIDIAQVRGTGDDGRVTEEDVRRHSSATTAATTPTASPVKGVEERVPLRGVRRRMAESMAMSLRTTAQFTLIDEVDVSKLVATRETLKPLAEKNGVKITYLPFVIKAVVKALKEYPYLNASLDDAKQEIVLKKDYNIGVAVDTGEGLVVPVIRDADKKSLFDLARNVEDLAQKARSSRLELDDIKGGTFSITSLGALGGLLATPIIHYPEVAILGVHRIDKKPVVRDGQIVVRDIAHISLSFDHRIIDGATAGRFTSRIKEMLEEPNQLIPELV